MQKMAEILDSFRYDDEISVQFRMELQKQKNAWHQLMFVLILLSVKQFDISTSIAEWYVIVLC